MPIQPARPGGRMLLATQASTNKQFVVALNAIIGALQVDATTVTLYIAGGIQATVNATGAEVLAAIDPAPNNPPPPPPPPNITQGKLRISPQGTVIAKQLEPLNPRGDWQIFNVDSAETNWWFTDNTKNPEIASWPYLTAAL